MSQGFVFFSWLQKCNFCFWKVCRGQAAKHNVRWPDGVVFSGLWKTWHQKIQKNIGGWMWFFSENRGIFPPNHPFLIGFSIIFTFHFGVPLFWKHPCEVRNLHGSSFNDPVIDQFAPSGLWPTGFQDAWPNYGYNDQTAGITVNVV